MLKISALFLIISNFFSGVAYANDATLSRIEKYLNNLTTITADFTQDTSDGNVAVGKFYLERPNKMRWEYEPPTPILMVSNGSFITYFDRGLAQISHIPIDSTLAAFLIRPKISFSDDITLDSLTKYKGIIAISVHQTAKADEGELTMEFADKPLVIRSFMIKDSSGEITKISFQNARFGQTIEPELFVFHDPTAPK